ncbi:PssE/Cps14G family polysaccharide biosynthesis glycosyltransferase [Vibrio sp. WXL103]|uniref:PssE/Cps14G family polysaccharide biosynthesis glycosyltransferase n=1 Tax=Vibrio sp. WXL103 TaxID=3450710 RepID=UPI003EC4C3B8
MNILVTVGTTAFDELIKKVDDLFSKVEEVNVIAQVSASSKYSPKHLKSFTFSSDFQAYVNSADLVITHAGAGSVYSMLENGKKLVVVPNLTRADNHQIELARYVHDNRFAISCFDLSEIKECIEEVMSTELTPYHCEKFFGQGIVLELLK